VQQNQTDTMQLRRGGLQGVKICGCGGRLTARMGLRHPHVPAPSLHLLTALPLGGRHRCIGNCTCHHWQRGEQSRQSENSYFLHKCQRHWCSRNIELDATGSEKLQITAVPRSPTQTFIGCTVTSSGACTNHSCPIAFNRLTLPRPYVRAAPLCVNLVSTSS
jgi:hypothetical protein